MELLTEQQIDYLNSKIKALDIRVTLLESSQYPAPVLADPVGLNPAPTTEEIAAVLPVDTPAVDPVDPVGV